MSWSSIGSRFAERLGEPTAGIREAAARVERVGVGASLSARHREAVASVVGCPLFERRDELPPDAVSTMALVGYERRDVCCLVICVERRMLRPADGTDDAALRRHGDKSSSYHSVITEITR